MHLYESHTDGCYLENEHYEPTICECGDRDRWVCEIDNEMQLIAEMMELECSDWHITELVNEYRDRNTKGQVNKAAIASAMFRSKNIKLVTEEKEMSCFHPKSTKASYNHEVHTHVEMDVVRVKMQPIRIMYGDKVINVGLAGRCSCGQIYFKEAK